MSTPTSSQELKDIQRIWVSTLTFAKPRMERFAKEGVIDGDFYLYARDAYQVAKWNVDLLKRSKGGLFRSGVDRVRLSFLKEEFVKSNPQFPADTVNKIFTPEVFQQLGFRIFRD